MSETKQSIGPNQERWLRMLESGEFSQCRTQLQRGDSFCCLGVACVLAGCERTADIDGAPEFDGEPYFAPQSAIDALALFGKAGQLAEGKSFGEFRSLSLANDQGVPFADIAAFCRANPEAVFTEPR